MIGPSCEVRKWAARALLGLITPSHPDQPASRANLARLTGALRGRQAAASEGAQQRRARGEQGKRERDLDR